MLAAAAAGRVDLRLPLRGRHRPNDEGEYPDVSNRGVRQRAKAAAATATGEFESVVLGFRLQRSVGVQAHEELDQLLSSDWILLGYRRVAPSAQIDELHAGRPVDTGVVEANDDRLVVALDAA